MTIGILNSDRSPSLKVEVTAPQYPLKGITIPFCLFLIINIFGHYYLACTIPPGFAGDGPIESYTQSNSWQWATPYPHKSPVDLNITQASESKCKRCGVLRPEVHKT